LNVCLKFGQTEKELRAFEAKLVNFDVTSGADRERGFDNMGTHDLHMKALIAHYANNKALQQRELFSELQDTSTLVDNMILLMTI
jgi:hypothetical protein